jgi:biotin operon repressor
MTRKKQQKKAPVLAATGTKAKAANQNVQTSRKNYITEFLHHGSENAVPMKDLAKLAGMNEREVRRAVALAQNNGFAVLSGKNGYYLPSENKAQRLAELKAWLAVKESRVESNRLSTQAARALLNDLEGDF